MPVIEAESSVSRPAPVLGSWVTVALPLADGAGLGEAAEVAPVLSGRGYAGNERIVACPDFVVVRGAVTVGVGRVRVGAIDLDLLGIGQGVAVGVAGRVTGIARWEIGRIERI